MPVTSIKTQKTELYRVLTATTVQKIGQITSVNGLGGSADQIDVSVFDSLEREFEAGFANPSALTLEIVYNPLDLSHQGLNTLKDSGAKVDWYIGLSDAVTAPTAVASAIVAPTTRSGFKFQGYIADVSYDFSTNEVVRASVTIQRSGASTPIYKV